MKGHWIARIDVTEEALHPEYGKRVNGGAKRDHRGGVRRDHLAALRACPLVHGRAPGATRRALNRPTRRRAREGPVGPRGQAWVGWSVQFAVGV